MRRVIAPCVLLVLVLVCQSVTAAVPQTMSYQGVLRQADGNVVPDGNYNLTFKIYNVGVGGVALWTEAQNLAVADGIFNAILGSVNPLGLAFDVQYWLGITVGVDPELSPRVQLTSSPYALRAKVADVGADDDWSFSGDDIYRLQGTVGIGAVPFINLRESKDGKEATEPRDRQSADLYVYGPGQWTTYSVLAEPDAAADGRAAIYGYRTRALQNDGTGYGVGTTNNAITGYNFWGDLYTFGVAGYTYGDFTRTGGVLGGGGGYWGALGYKDENSTWWGAYTPYNAYVGGFRMPTGAAAGEVLTCDANGVGSWLPSVGGIGGGGTANYVPKFTAATTLGNSNLYDNGSAVGIGTTSPTSRMTIVEASTGQALEAVTSYNGSVGRTVNFERTQSIAAENDVLQLMVPSTAPADAQFIECETGVNGFQFRLHTNGDMDVYGDATVDGTLDVNSTGLRAGDFSSSNASMATHVVHSECTAVGSYDAYAVYGRSVPADYYGYGGVFEGGYYGVLGSVSPTGSATYHGVSGEVNGGSGTNYGVYGYAYGTGTKYGVYGYAGGTGTNYAGYFSGNVAVTGTLSKGGGSFKIDHPLDPENKYLYHSFVESPDMMNIYNGNIVLDANGEARIQMPEWFDALNRDFRSQLTAIGAPGPNLYVSEKISGNEFAIAGGEPGAEVSWQVTGIRHDPFADAHRIPVEEDKPANERGKYLHPDVYGMPDTKSVSYVEEKPLPESTEQYQDARTRHPITGAENDGAD
jgi:hypothetical protein